MYVIINGVSSDTIQGLQVLSLPSITKPKMRRQVDTIDGRDGDIITELGYEAYDRTITVLLHHNYDLDAITKFFNTSGEIIFSNEPDKKYNFRLLEKIDYERAVRFKTANITFHVQPYKYPVNETPLTVSTTAWEGTDYDQTPYIFRATKDSSVEVGNRAVIEQITGGTVAWNQLVQNGNFADGTNGWSKGSGASSIAASNGEMTITIGGTWNNDIRQSINIYSGHVYVCRFSVKADDSLSGKTSAVFNTTPSAVFAVTSSTLTSSYTTTEKIIKATASDSTVRVTLTHPGTNYIGQKFYLKNVMLIDLTQMFGSTIADYIYSLEQSTAGAGVSLFKSLFPKDYYAYNAGELMSVKTSARETVGKNLLNVTDVTVASRTFNVDSDGWITAENKTSDPRPFTYANSQWYATLPKGTYYLDYWCANVSTSTSRTIALYLNDNSKVADTFRFGENGSVSFTLSDTNTVGVLAKIYESTIRIQIRSADAPTGYEPYEKHTYPLSNIELRGIPKLVDNKLQYDGDIYKSDGGVTRRYGIVDLGTLSWTRFSSWGSNTNMYLSTDLQSVIKAPTSDANIANAIAEGYITVSRNTANGSSTDLLIDIAANGAIHIVNHAYTDAAAFKTAMSGVYLVYELASPTTETTTPYTETQICSPYGTEEFIDSRDVQIPVGHKTKYKQINDPAEIIVPNAGNVPSAPTIQLTGSGTVGVYLGNAQTLQVNIPEDGITIDTEAQDATSNGQLANRSVTGDYDSVRLQPGDNDVSFSGDVSAVITNYTRWV